MIKAAENQQSFVKEVIPEKEWWHLLKAGNRSVLSMIYGAYIENMFGYGMSIVANRDFVKDCIQDVFVDLWKYRANLANTDNIKFYLLRSLRNKIFHLLTKEKKYQSQKNDDQPTIITPSHEDVLISDQRNQLIQNKLASCIEKLPERQKEVVRHLYFENHSYEETSNIMAINLRSVYTLAWKALASLRKALPNIYLFLGLVISNQAIFPGGC
jgi:RNA polymerase sigma factor (sigma-70 family)